MNRYFIYKIDYYLFQIKLTLQKFDIANYNPEPVVGFHEMIDSPYVGKGVSKIISGERLQLQAQRPTLDNVPHVAMYLTLCNEEMHTDKVCNSMFI